MCQASIGKVISAESGKLTVECKGKTLELRSKLPGVEAGDYVMFSLDIAIDKIDKEELSL
jgi:hydrogenase maturation factor